MERPFLLHFLTPQKNASPFDVNMAYDAGWDAVTTYTGIDLDEVTSFVQDVVFSRGPKGARRTGIFIGGRDVSLATEMGQRAESAMISPFQVSVFVDPSGAFTTSAAAIASIERHLGSTLSGLKVYVFGGMGPVASTCGILAALDGADVWLVDRVGAQAIGEHSAELARKYGVQLAGADAPDTAQQRELLNDADVVLSAGPPGVQVLASDRLVQAPRLRVAADLNAVPPPGLEGVGSMDDGVPIQNSVSGAVGIGALVIGGLKYKVQNALFALMRTAEQPVYLDFKEALNQGRSHAAP